MEPFTHLNCQAPEHTNGSCKGAPDLSFLAARAFSLYLYLQIHALVSDPYEPAKENYFLIFYKKENGLCQSKYQVLIKWLLPPVRQFWPIYILLNGLLCDGNRPVM